MSNLQLRRNYVLGFGYVSVERRIERVRGFDGIGKRRMRDPVFGDAHTKA